MLERLPDRSDTLKWLALVAVFRLVVLVTVPQIKYENVIKLYLHELSGVARLFGA